MTTDRPRVPLAPPWDDPKTWPDDLPARRNLPPYVFLGRAWSVLGAAMLGEAWTGDELAARQIPPPDERGPSPVRLSELMRQQPDPWRNLLVAKVGEINAEVDTITARGAPLLLAVRDACRSEDLTIFWLLSEQPTPLPLDADIWFRKAALDWLRACRIHMAEVWGPARETLDRRPMAWLYVAEPDLTKMAERLRVARWDIERPAWAMTDATKGLKRWCTLEAVESEARRQLAEKHIEPLTKNLNDRIADMATELGYGRSGEAVKASTVEKYRRPGRRPTKDRTRADRHRTEAG